MITKPSALTLQMLAWLAESPRTYGQTMDIWRTSCPRLSIWEDALAQGLIAIEVGSVVVVTDSGRALLDRFG